MHNDRDFAHIERRKDGAHVCIPADWDVVVQEACPRKPFDVVAMEPSKFVDFTEQTKQYTQRKTDTKEKACAHQQGCLDKLWTRQGYYRRGQETSRQSVAKVLLQ